MEEKKHLKGPEDILYDAILHSITLGVWQRKPWQKLNPRTMPGAFIGAIRGEGREILRSMTSDQACNMFFYKWMIEPNHVSEAKLKFDKVLLNGTEISL